MSPTDRLVFWRLRDGETAPVLAGYRQVFASTSVAGYLKRGIRHAIGRIELSWFLIAEGVSIPGYRLLHNYPLWDMSVYAPVWCYPAHWVAWHVWRANWWLLGCAMKDGWLKTKEGEVIRWRDFEPFGVDTRRRAIAGLRR